MERLRNASPWLFGLVAWAAATGTVAVGYLLWTLYAEEPFAWGLLRDAALMAGPIAAFMAWSESRRRRK